MFGRVTLRMLIRNNSISISREICFEARCGLSLFRFFVNFERNCVGSAKKYVERIGILNLKRSSWQAFSNYRDRKVFRFIKFIFNAAEVPSVDKF